MKNKKARGYTLIELIIAVGLFALIMMLASGAYLVMIGINRQAQAMATGINNLAFALETMTRTIRTGTDYSSSCSDCFSVRNDSGNTITFALSSGGSSITQNNVPLTDPSVTVTSLKFFASGLPRGDSSQARVTIVVAGWVSSGSGGKKEYFNIETGATMRGIDI